MKCDRCEKPALVHTTHLVEGRRRESHLCEKHTPKHLRAQLKRMDELNILNISREGRKCDLCTNPAVVHTSDMVKGAPRERHLCEEHTREHLGEELDRISEQIRSRASTFPKWLEAWTDDWLEKHGLLTSLESASAEEWYRMDKSGLLADVPRLPNPELVVPVLIDELQDERPAVRYVMARWLGQMGAAAKESIPHLRRLLDDEDQYVRRVAEEALTKIEGAPGE